MMRLSDAIDTYLEEYGALRDWAEQSTSSYGYRLKSFVEFHDDPNINLAAALTQENAARYFNWLQQRGYKDTTIYAKKQAFSAFWSWCQERKLISKALDMRLKKPENPPVVYLTSDEAALIEQATLGGTSLRSIIHLRDQAAFALLAETELSLRALSDLTVDDYDPTARTLSIGNITILLSDHLCELIDHYLQARSIYGEVKMPEPLFAAYTGAPWSKSSIRKAVQRHRQTAGLPKLAKGKRTHLRHWPEKERQRFLSHPVESYDRAIEQAQIVVALGLHCGLRREEMRTLTAGDVDLFHKSMNVLGKGDKRRIVPLNGHILQALEPIVRARRAGQTILVDENGEPLTERRINGIVNVLVERASITYKKVTPHTLRHTFATRLFERGVDIVIVKELMGHSRIEETLRYIHLNEDSQRKAVELLVPGASIDVKEHAEA